MTETYATLIGIGLQTIIWLLGGYAMVIRSDMSNRTLAEEVIVMKQELKKLSDVITIQAVQTNRLDYMDQHMASLEKRVEDLRRGRGLVTNND